MDGGISKTGRGSFRVTDKASADSQATNTSESPVVRSRTERSVPLETLAPRTARSKGDSGGGAEGGLRAPPTPTRRHKLPSTRSMNPTGEHSGMVGPFSQKSHLNANPQSALNADSAYLVGVARWPDPVHNKEDTQAQQRYGHAFSDHSVLLGKQIAIGRVTSLGALWRECRDWRVRMEVEANGPDVLAMSSVRKPPASGAQQVTYACTAIELAGRYGYIHPRITASASFVEKKDAVRDRQGVEIVPPHLAHVRNSSAKLRGGPVSLTTMVAFTSPDNAQAPLARLVQGNRAPKVGLMFHTPAQALDETLKEASSIFEEVLAKPMDHQQLLDSLANIHWLLAQAMPDHRGSAAKAEMAVRAMAHALDFELPPFQYGVQPDIESFLTEREAFVAAYPQLLEDRAAMATRMPVDFSGPGLPQRHAPALPKSLQET